MIARTLLKSDGVQLKRLVIKPLMSGAEIRRPTATASPRAMAPPADIGLTNIFQKRPKTPLPIIRIETLAPSVSPFNEPTAISDAVAQVEQHFRAVCGHRAELGIGFQPVSITAKMSLRPPARSILAAQDRP